MNCLKYRYEQHVQSETGPHCGIVFEKYLKYHPVQTDQQDIQPSIVTLYEEDEAQPLTHSPATLAYFSGRSFIFAGLIILIVPLFLRKLFWASLPNKRQKSRGR